MEPPNKGHIGDNINTAIVSFVERLSSSPNVFIETLVVER